jgi:hypothetical protein
MLVLDLPQTDHIGSPIAIHINTGDDSMRRHGLRTDRTGPSSADNERGNEREGGETVRRVHVAMLHHGMRECGYLGESSDPHHR